MAGGVEVKFVIDNAALNGLLRGPSGPVYINMLKRADILQRAAKAQIPIGQDVPRTSRGHLKNSVVKRIYPNTTGEILMEIWVGSDHPNALLHHNGTRPHPIEPKYAKVLRFDYGGDIVFAMFVHHPGTAPNPFLTDNLPLVTA